MVHLHKNFFWTLWSLALAEKSCKNIKNRRAQASRLYYFLWLWFYFTILARSRCQFCKWYKYRYWKEGKKRSTLLYKIVWFISKGLFFGKLIFGIVPIYENLKDSSKNFFPFSWKTCLFDQVAFTASSQGVLHWADKENLVYLMNTIKGKIKTSFYYGIVSFSKSNKFK